ncbi:PaaI family thioesterase [uncultured Desulfuromusa sp.]|uniref:PaaI family thioesterase n=1 Tax=uncultured Desulfuromusa sp. TaxID=219183 RepID=UPI002AA90929|nr:PaaI family thioesterase [uncultured Desulfuromusa sp.]
MQQIMDFFTENDCFARHCGIELIELKPGHAKAKMDIQPFHMNGAKTVQGGAIFTLADFTFAAAVNSQGRLAMAINTSISFFKPTLDGTLYAEAEELSISHKLGYYQINITDMNQQLVAQFQGTAYRKQKPILTETME